MHAATATIRRKVPTIVGGLAERVGSASPSMRRVVALLAGLVTSLMVVLGAAAAQSAEHPEERGIDAACSRAAQEASQETEHPAEGFPDIDGNVHEAAINCLAHRDIAQGREGHYVPREAVRRDAMASFIARTLRPTDYDFPQRGENDPPAFGDTDGNVHEDNINRLADAGIVQGRNDGNYHPSAPVSRAAMASFIARALETVTGEELTDGDPAFADTQGNVHEDNITALAEHGIVQGRDDGTYGPDEPVRRDAMASFIARSMDYLAEQGHWPVPSNVMLEPAEDTNPANFIHRLRGMVFDQWGTDEHDNGLYAADVRVEVHRGTTDGYALVRTDRIFSGLGGDLMLNYNAGATAGDRDVIVACPLRADQHPAEDEAWCAQVDTAGGDATVVAREDRGADAVTAAWTQPAEPEPAAEGWYPGNVVAHHPDDALIDLQTADRTDGADDPEALLRLAYQERDAFTVSSPQGRHEDVTVEQFACALQAGLDQGEDAFPHLTVQYDPIGQSLFDLSVGADVTHCLSADDGFSHEERASEDFPHGGPAQLTDVRTAVHDEFDRVVFELPGEPVGWDVRWEDEPRADGSGEPVPVEGNAYLSVTTTSVARWADGTYDGPDRIAINGNIATEAVLTGDFEGMTTWVIGLHHEHPFRADLLNDPQRLVVDVAS